MWPFRKKPVRPLCELLAKSFDDDERWAIHDKTWLKIDQVEVGETDDCKQIKVYVADQAKTLTPLWYKGSDRKRMLKPFRKRFDLEKKRKAEELKRQREAAVEIAEGVIKSTLTQTTGGAER